MFLLTLESELLPHKLVTFNLGRGLEVMLVMNPLPGEQHTHSFHTVLKGFPTHPEDHPEFSWGP